MSNLSNIYSELIQQNYLIPTYYFVTLGESGGFSEYIKEKFQKDFFGDMKGYAMFPKMNFMLEDVETKNFKSDQINTEKILNFSDKILEEMTEPSAMLIVSCIKIKVKD